jgi:hypothetical protein
MALDAIEAARPHVDYWLLAYLASSAFANRGFTELSEGEIRLSHPLNSHLAHTAALWRNLCEPIATWLAHSFSRAVGLSAALTDDRKISMRQMVPPKLSEQGRRFDPLTPLPAFSGPRRGRLTMRLQGALKDNPIPMACWECGKALASRRIRFCSNDCARASPVYQLYCRADLALPMQPAPRINRAGAGGRDDPHR